MTEPSPKPNAPGVPSAWDEVRTRAELALAGDQGIFAIGFDEASTPTALIDGLGRYVRANKAYAQLFRVDASWLIGRTVESLTHPEELVRDRGLLDEMRSGARRTAAVEKRYVRPDGTVIFAKASGIVLAMDGPSASLMMSEVIDQTELVETMQELRESQRRLEMALDATGGGIYEADFATGDIALNSRAERMLGYEGDQIPRRIEDWAALVHPEDLAGAFQQIEEHARGERSGLDKEIRMRHRNGEWMWVQDRARIVDFLPDGAPRLLIGTLTDISARRRASDLLEQQTQVFDTLLSNVPIFVVFLRPDGSFQYMNRTFERGVGWSLEETRDRDMLAEFYPDPVYRAKVAEFMAGRHVGAAWHDWRLRTRDGRELVTSWTNVRLDDGRLIGIGQDVTELRLAETERRQLETQLLQAQKLESLGVLAGGVAHDFNNLLVGILGNASLAEDALPPAHPATPLVGEMRAAASRAAELTRQLLAYAGKGRFVIERVSLSALAEEMVALLRAVISKNATLRCELAAALPGTEGDATQLRQIVMNLITNASESLEDAPGLITLRTGTMVADEAFVRSTVGDATLRPGPCVYLEVEDTGRGMEPETLERIFDPFFTTKFTGRGLGLAATLGIIRSHSGAISVRSVRGVGTTIRLVLPSVAAAETRSPARTSGARPLQWRTEGDVLLADDEQAVREVARRGLERIGLCVTEAVDGQHALDLFRADPARWRLVVLDLTMPNVSGDAALRVMRELRPDLRALLYSGYSADALSKDLTSQPGIGFLQKPFTVSVLASAVRDALESDVAR